VFGFVLDFFYFWWLDGRIEALICVAVIGVSVVVVLQPQTMD